MNRWCIIAGPRSGSVYVEQLLYQPISKLDSSLVLGEFLAPNLGVSHKIYGLDADRNITSTNVNSPMDVGTIDLEKFYQDRLSLMRSANTTQPLTMRMFCQNYLFPMDRYLGFLELLRDRNFGFISLERNLLDRTISFYFMINHGRLHRFRTRDGYSISTNRKDGDLPLVPTVVDMEKFMILYRQVVDDDHLRRLATSVLGCPIVRYETVVDDFKKLGIPIGGWVSVRRTYDEDYRNVILNYQEMIETIAREQE